VSVTILNISSSLFIVRNISSSLFIVCLFLLSLFYGINCGE
jgi:hypothetical protein